MLVYLTSATIIIFTMFPIMTMSFEGIYKPSLEVLKATEFAQKELKYSNDINYLICNNNQWALTAALSLKYGYNPLDEKPTISLKPKDIPTAIKDFTQYHYAAKQTKTKLINERRKNKASCQKLIIKGSTIATASIFGLIILSSIPFPLSIALSPITMPLSFLAIACAIYGAKKIYDGVFYQDYLKSSIKQNEKIEKILQHASKQLANNTSTKFDAVAKDIKNRINGESGV